MTMVYKCNNCGSAATPVTTQKGNMKLQIFLWFFFIIPGLFYSMWRETTKQAVCGVCGANEIKSKQVMSDYKPARPLPAGASGPNSSNNFSTTYSTRH
ncbi:MAG: hypothetical protein JKY98_10355 [Gammaproteobacteria bacterium]|nr:hypothetical protein [Gammaproteobacteria bacterium]